MRATATCESRGLRMVPDLVAARQGSVTGPLNEMSGP